MDEQGRDYSFKAEDNKHFQRNENNSKASRYQSAGPGSAGKERFPESGANRDQTNLHSHIEDLRGPQGYRRSDERIREVLTDLITDDRMIDSRDLSIRVADGEVMIHGYVPDRTTEQRIYRIIEAVPGVKKVRNELKLNPHANDGVTNPE